MDTASILNANDVYSQFSRFLIDLGFDADIQVVGDGKRHRTFVRGKNGQRKRDGVYTLYMDGIPAGWAQCHAGGGEVHKWRYKTDTAFTPSQRNEWRRQAAEQSAKRQQELEQQHAKAAQTARWIWSASEPLAEGHPYLERKGVQAHRIKAREYRGATSLVIPLYSIETAGGQRKSTLQTLEFIGVDGSKKFLPGGKKAGAMHALGIIDADDAILLAEGYATAATAQEATGSPAVMCADCGNMMAVAKMLRAVFPKNMIVICADDDHLTVDAHGRRVNPGVVHATAAAKAIGALLAMPTWKNGRPNQSKDFNDLAQDEGIEAVRKIVFNAR